MKADIIIPFHDRAAVLIRCLRALSAASRIQGKVFLVDDSSSAAERQLVYRAIDALPLPIEWIGLPRRSGFVGAVNATWPRCGHPVSVILNSDTVPPTNLLPTVVATLERDPTLAAAAPTSDNMVDLYQYRPAEPMTRGLRNGEITCVPYITAMCLAVRRCAVGGPLFDPAFSPGYFEDLDLSCRLRMAGWRLGVLEGCRIHHMGRATFGLDPNLSSIMTRNYATFAERWSHLPEHGDLVVRLRAPAVGAGARS